MKSTTFGWTETENSKKYKKSLLANSNMSEDKKKAKRHDLGSSAVARILKHGARLHLDTPRVSEDAIKPARRAVSAELHELGTEAVDHLKLVRRHGLKDQSPDVDHEHADVETLAKHHMQCYHLAMPPFPKKKAKEGEKKDVSKGLSLEGVIRVFEEAYKGGKKEKLRISAPSKALILKFAEDYLYNLGARAGRYAKVAGRQTLSRADIKMAAADLAGK